MLDAAPALAAFMVDGVDPARFRRTPAPVLDAAAASRERGIRACGGMVDALWKGNQPAAALRLEALWNPLAHTYPLSLLRGYATDNADQGSGVLEICRHHSHVMLAGGNVALVTWLANQAFSQARPVPEPCDRHGRVSAARTGTAVS